MHLDAEFEGESDFDINHGMTSGFDWLTDDQSQSKKVCTTRGYVVRRGVELCYMVFVRPYNLSQSIFFQYEPMHLDAEFEGESDFDIKHGMTSWFDWLANNQSQSNKVLMTMGYVVCRGGEFCYMVFERP